MKRRNIALTLMATFCLFGATGPNECRADNPFDKLIPRGKLLKMLKDEITGEEEKAKIPDPRRNVRPRPTAAPTPAARTGNERRPTQSREPQRVASRPQSPTRTRPLPPISTSARKRQAMSSNATSENRKVGFGMMIEESGNDQMIVTAVQRDGNADRAGLRAGDQLLSVGGGKLTAVEEFKQIAKTLGQGDQIEIVFARQGKKRKSLLQFGSAPQEGEVAASGRNIVGIIESAEIDNSMQSVLDSPVERVSRLEPITSRPSKATTGKITSLNQTIDAQRIKMQAMAEELKLLRKAHQPAVEPTENNWSFPGLAGPDAK